MIFVDYDELQQNLSWAERAFACGVVTIHPAKQKRKPAGALFSWDARKIFIGSFYDELV